MSERSKEQDSAARTADLLGTAAAALLGFVLILAAWSKAVDPAPFVEQVRLEGLDFLFSAKAAALIALALEAGLGMLLLLGVRRTWVLVPTGLLIGLFLFITGRNYWLVLQGLRDPNFSCGCFGGLVKRSPGQAFWQDLLLLVPPFVISVWGRPVFRQQFPRIRLALSALAAISIVSFTWRDSDLRYLDLAQAIAASRPEETFQLDSQYGLLIDGIAASGASIFHSEATLGFLILEPRLPEALLVDPRSGGVSQVARVNLLKTPSGSYVLKPGTSPAQVGQFSIGGEGIRFQAEGHRFTMVPRSPASARAGKN